VSSSSPSPKPSEQPATPAGGAPWRLLPLLIVLLLGTWLWREKAQAVTEPQVDYSTFYTWVEQGKVEAVVLKGPQLTGTLVLHTLEAALVQRETLERTELLALFDVADERTPLFPQPGVPSADSPRPVH